MKSVFLCLFLLAFAMPAKAEEAKPAEGKEKPPVTETVESDELPDFSKIRNPFTPKLPIKEKVKTPVDPRTKPGKIVVKPPVKIETPKEEVPVVLPKVRLAGIIWGVEPPQAIINDTIVSVGDTLLEMQVKSIRKDGVTVVFSGKEFQLKME